MLVFFSVCLEMLCTKNSYPMKHKLKEMKLTTNQKRFVNSINNKKLVFLDGPAGSGKTLLSCKYAIEKLNTSEVKNVIITRPAISIHNEQHGFLPGDLNEKMGVWVAQLLENFMLFESERKVKQYISNGHISIVPLAYMRGLTFEDSIVIGDEMQNSSTQQMLALLTRIGQNCQMIITGDGNQSDVLELGVKNGLKDFIDKYAESDLCEDIEVVKFTDDDIKRSELTKFISEMYSR